MTQAANLGALGTNAGTTGILPIAGGGTAGTGGAIGFKNRIINGAMVISQRGTSFSTSSAYTLDRWYTNTNTAGAWTITQSSTAPAGFINSLLYTKTTGNTPGASDYNYILQSIEGLNCADLAWGTASAKTITLSFWVYSGATGTFGGSLRNSAGNRSYPFTYTVSSANTWTQASVTIAGDTSGTWLTTNGTGVCVFFDVGSGANARATAGAWIAGNYIGATGTSTYPNSTSGGVLYITGVQFEVGTAATNFDVRSYGTELMLCQRYCQMFNSNEWNDTYRRYADVLLNNTTSYNGILNLLVKMRSTPALTTSGSFSLWNGSFLSSVSAPTIASTGADVVDITGTNGTGTLGGIYHLLSSANNTSYMLFTAEL